MSTHLLTSAVLLAGVLALGGTPGLRAGEMAFGCQAKSKLVQRSYQVADLVNLLDAAEAPGGQEEAGAAGASPRSVGWVVEGGRSRVASCLRHDRLMKLIASTVEPGSWSQQGGPGTMDYFPLGMMLVINQTPGVHEQISQLLASLRRGQDTEVTIELRVLSLADDFFERLGSDFDLHRRRCPTEKDIQGVAFLDDRELKVARLLEKYHRACVEGKLNRAMKLALRALALDPACFSKERPKAEPTTCDRLSGGIE